MAMAKELKVERERSALNVLELTHVWDGGEFITDIRREVGKHIATCMNINVYIKYPRPSHHQCRVIGVLRPSIQQ